MRVLAWFGSAAAVATLAIVVVRSCGETQSVGASRASSLERTSSPATKRDRAEPATPPTPPDEETSDTPVTSARQDEDPNPWNVRLAVSVVSADGRRPIVNADVRVIERYEPTRFRDGRTDATGRVSLDAPRRLADVAVRARGFVARLVDSTPQTALATDSECRIEIGLVPGAPLRGRVVRSGTGAGVAGAEVYAWDATTLEEIDFDPALIDGSEAAGLRTGVDGGFEFSALPPGRDVIVAARAPGLATVSQRLRADAIPAEVVLEIGGGGTLHGIVRDPAGVPIANCDVYVVARGDSFGLRIPAVRSLFTYAVRLAPWTRTSANGSWRIEGLAVPGAYVVTAARDRWDRGLAEPVELAAPGSTAARDVVVFEHAWIDGSLLGPGGEPADFGGFEIFTTDGRPYENPFANGSSSQGSTFHSTDVVPGEYVIEVRARGPWPPVRRTVVVIGGGGTKAEFRFAPGASLTGVVTDEAGSPVGGVTVRSCSHEVDTGADGRFRLDGVVAGPLSVDVVDDRGRYLPARLDSARADAGPLAVRLARGPDVVFSAAVPAGEDSVCCSGRTSRSTFVWWAHRLADGRFHLGHMKPGEPFDLTIRLAKDRAPIVRRGLRVDGGATLDLGSFDSLPGATVHGVVLSPNGRPVAGATVAPIDRDCGESATTDSSGAFRLDGLPTTDVLLVVTAEGAPRTTRLLARDPSDGVREIRLDAGVEVTGRVLDASGAPVCSEDLLVRPAGDGGAAPSAPTWLASTDSLGEFRVLVPAGRYALFVHRFVARGMNEEDFDDLPAGEFEARVPGPSRVEARLR